MRFSSADGVFSAEIHGSQAEIRFNLDKFQGQFTLKEMPPKLANLLSSLLETAESIDSLTRIIIRELRGE